jgi:ABC-type glycerol-3-phosphate transport system substrate-binding protein
MSGEPKKVDRRSFLYVGLGAVALVAIGAAAYIAMNPPVVTQTVTTATTVPTTSVVTTTTATTVTTATTTTTATTVTTTTGVQKPKLTVLYMSTYAPAINDWLTARTLVWAAKRGVDVEVSTASYMEIKPKILTGVETGNPPDLVFGGGDLVALLAEDPKARHIEPIDDVYKELGEDDIIEKLMKWYTIDGKRFAIDLALHANQLHLIKSFVTEVGRKPEELVTWDDYIEFAREVKRRHPDMYPLGFTLGKCYDGTETWYLTWWPHGGEMCTGRSSTAVKFDSPESRENLQRIIDWYNAGLINPQMLQADEMLNNNAYLTKSAAFIIEGPTPYYAAVTRNPELAGDTILKAPPKGPKGQFTWGSQWPLYTFSASKNKDLAKDLIIFIMKDKAEYKKMILSGLMAVGPTYKSVTDELVKDPNVGHLYQVYKDILPIVTFYSYPLNEPTKAMDTVQANYLVADLFSMTLIDKKDVDTAVRTVGDQIKQIFKQTYGQ